MNILAIGGSDPSSGAGVQSDVRAATSLGAHCFCIVTAITAQNSTGFFGVEPVSPKAVKNQIDSVLSDFAVDAVSIGMVYDSKIISSVHAAIKGLSAPVVLDPVIRSTTGGTLLQKAALRDLKRLLIPLAHTITPNIYEAEIISGTKIKGVRDMKEAARKIAGMGATNVVITGCEFERNKISDFVYENQRYCLLSSKKIPGQNHGSGGNFAIALAYSLSQKNKLAGAVRFAKKFAYEAIMESQGLGHGVKITNPKKDAMLGELAGAIREFQGLRDVTSLIPEVQTNFVYAKPAARAVDDVIGVSGRIVRAGRLAVVAGSIQYGGSMHVGTAVLTVKAKFPQIRSAINIRYDDDTIKKFQRAEYKILSYDRKKEPGRSRARENSTVSWGVASAIRNSDVPPDVIYHKGDLGKEPMIIVFGSSPKDVLKKIRALDP